MGIRINLPARRREATRRYVMDAVCDEDHPNDPVVLIVRSACEDNADYNNAVFKAEASDADPKIITMEWIEAKRSRIIERFAKHVVIGWENVYEDGKPLPCTPSAVTTFLRMLCASPPGHPELLGAPQLFDELKEFCMTRSNFHEPTIGAVELGKK